MSWENLQEQLRELPANLSHHLRITVVPLLLGLSVSLPLAVLIVRRKRLRYPALTAVAIVQTIPSLALLALMVPVLAGVSGALSLGLSPLGFLPAVLALTLYSMLPIVRNTVTGILGVDPTVTEAARGVGMTPRQVLLRVELPLAAPVMVAGVRTATVWTVGIATLATPVGQRCLGNFIFRGLQTRNWTAVLVGCASAAGLAILLDLLIGGVERAVAERRRRLGWISGGALAAVLVLGLFAPSLARAWTGKAAADEVTWIGSKTFTEQYVLAALIADVLEDAGYATRERESLGSTVIFDALVSGDLDVYVDYTGTIWANHMRREGVASAEEVLREVGDWLREEHGAVALGALGFENAYALAMRRRQAEELGVRTIADLAPHAPEMAIGGDYEFFGRPEWRSLRGTYGLSFADQRSFDSTFMYEAVARGDVDVISAFTSDGRILSHDLVVLEDPRRAIPPYDAVLLLSAEAARDPGLVAALEPLLGALPVELVREANLQVDRAEDPRTVEQAARWLRARALEE